MRKIFCVFLFLWCTSALFAQQYEPMYTNEGLYYVVGEYLMKANTQMNGQRVYELMLNIHTIPGYTTLSEAKLTKGQWECVNAILNRYDSTRGDMYSIAIVNASGAFIVRAIVEYTSNAQYSYWLMGYAKQ